MTDLFRLFKYVKPFAGRLVLAIILTIFVGLFETGFRALLEPTLDRLNPESASNVSGPKTAAPAAASSSNAAAKLSQAHASWLNRINDLLPRGNRGWYILLALFPLFAIGKGFCDFHADYFMGVVGLGAIVRIRQDLYEHVMKQSARFFNKYPTNDVISRLSNDIQKLEAALSRLVADLLREFFKLVGYLTLIFIISWKLTLYVLLLAPVISYITTLSGRRLKKLGTTQQVGNQEILNIAQETISGYRVVKAFGMERFETNRFAQAARDLMRAGIRSVRIDALSPSLVELIGMLGFALLFLYARPLIFSDQMSFNDFFTYIVLLFSLYDPVRKLSRTQNAFMQAFACSGRVFTLLDTHTEIEDRPDSVELKDFRHRIEFRDVSFKYENSRDAVVRNIDLTVEAGEVVAIVGLSGAGKTTVTNLLMRFFDPTSGQILIDGHDICDIKLDSLRRQIGLVTQEVMLFNDTVRNNIAYGRPDISQQQLEEAARAALVHDFVMERPGGYDLMVGERGIQLSGGQRQRLAIARALLKNAPILILDEATSALDTESEFLVQRALSNLLRNRTTIVIAHRLSTIRRADKIVVMEDGRIVELGRHDQLLARNGVYRRLYDLQFADDDLIAMQR